MISTGKQRVVNRLKVRRLNWSMDVSHLNTLKRVELYEDKRAYQPARRKKRQNWCQIDGGQPKPVQTLPATF